jgi:hypothetical protein
MLTRRHQHVLTIGTQFAQSIKASGIRRINRPDT